MRKLLILVLLLSITVSASALSLETGVVGYRFEESSKETGVAVTKVYPSFFLGIEGDNGEAFLYGKETRGDLGLNKDIGTVRLRAEVGWQIFEMDRELYLDAKVIMTNPVGPFTIRSMAFIRGYGLCDINGIDDRTDRFSTGLGIGLEGDYRYVGFMVSAGIESWQKATGGMIVGGFSPSSVRNSFSAEVDVRIGKFGVMAKLDYFCDHPEVPWRHAVKVVSNLVSKVFVVAITALY